MRMLKCYLANNRDGHFVTAEEAMNAPGQIWSCASCGCRLVCLRALSAALGGMSTIRRPWPGMC